MVNVSPTSISEEEKDLLDRCEDVILKIPFIPGASILFNAYSLTHRQKIEEVGDYPMINVGMHSNKKFGKHYGCSLERLKKAYA